MGTQDGAQRGMILLVEDEDLLRRSIQTFLERRGFLVESVRNGEEALGRLKAAFFDLLVTDLALVGPDGLALAKEARALHPETQVVIITGQGSKDTVLRALHQGIADYLEKPFDLEQLHIAVARAFESARLLRELVRLSRTDGLTGLFNQRHFHTVLEAEIGRARRQGYALSLLIVDVDEFKRFNDRFGHLAGDAALARVASCLKKACRRDTDTAYRYGGDEFVLLLPEADLATAASVADRVRALIAEEGIPLTVSLGAAELREGQDPPALFREADAAMFSSKRAAPEHAGTRRAG